MHTEVLKERSIVTLLVCITFLYLVSPYYVDLYHIINLIPESDITHFSNSMW